jgi:hypothetical protein
MLKKLILRVILLSIMIGSSGCALLIFGTSQSFKACIPRHTERESKDATRELEAGPVLASDIRLYARCSAGVLKKYNEAITATSTTVMAIFTILLVFVSNRQARLTREALELGNKEFRLTHRPKIHVRYIEASAPNSDRKTGANVTVANTGASAALNAYITRDMFVRKKKSSGLANFTMISSNSAPKDIAAGTTESFLIVDPHRALLTADGLADIRADTSELCLVGAVHYRDGNGRPRSTGFFRVWSSERKRFIRTAENDEYAEYEFEE